MDFLHWRFRGRRRNAAGVGGVRPRPAPTRHATPRDAHSITLKTPTYIYIFPIGFYNPLMVWVTSGADTTSREVRELLIPTIWGTQGANATLYEGRELLIPLEQPMTIAISDTGDAGSGCHIA